VSVVGVLRFVKRSQELGFRLTEVEEQLSLAEGGPDSCDRARTLAAAHAAELDRKIADLHQMRASLGELVATCERPRADRSCPLLEAIDSSDARAEVT
jgi:DNA-binding transcriptional MerR regulator